MIDFDLKHAHPEYRDLIVRTYEGLVAKYPRTPLRTVLVYPEEAAHNCKTCTNLSLGDATRPGEIRLNGHWLSRPIAFLKAAGEVDDEVPGYPGLRWHGGLPQPYQVLLHEGFHCVYDGIPQAKEFAYMLWLEATHDPMRAVSGYCAFGGDTPGSELFADTGAAYELDNPTGNGLVEELGRFLADVG